MCDFKNGFKLCSCQQEPSIHNKNSRRNRNKLRNEIEYKWVLNKYLGPLKTPGVEVLGIYSLSEDNIGNGLSAVFVLQHLNEKNCFDFDYTPVDGDNLMFYREGDGAYMEFIYKKGKWVEYQHSPFDDVFKKISNGKIKEIQTLLL